MRLAWYDYSMYLYAMDTIKSSNLRSGLQLQEEVESFIERQTGSNQLEAYKKAQFSDTVCSKVRVLSVKLAKGENGVRAYSILES